MSVGDKIKITFNHDSLVMNFYLPGGQTFETLKQNVEDFVFVERNQPRSELHYYWIDEDGDEIDTVGNRDLKIFYDSAGKPYHIYVYTNDARKFQAGKTTQAAPSSSEPETQIPPADDNNVHNNVECDSCLMSPIVGFRYKCIQCSNYDLCQICEAKHVHPEHMMVRMPNKGCPYVIDAFITRGRKSGRKYEKRCKSGETPRFPCGFASASAGTGGIATGCGDKSGESADTSGQEGYRHGRKHRRHVRHNFLSNLYEMMHDLAEGGGDAAVAAAMGDDEPTTAEEGANDAAGSSKQAAAALAAAENAKKMAAKAAEVAVKVTQQAALSAAAAAAGLNEKDGPTTSFQSTQQPCPSVPVFPSPPSLENLSQFLSPQYMKAGIDILNNFSDMFAKMLDPVDVGESSPTSSCPFMRKDSTTSTQSTNTKKSNDDSIKTNDSQNSDDNKQNENNTTKPKPAENAQNENQNKSFDNILVDVTDLGSDSESDGNSEGFVKLNAPSKESTPEKANNSLDTSITPSNASTAPPSLNKSETMNFAQLSADLKAHIAQEQQKEEEKLTNKSEESEPKVERELRAVPVFKQMDTQDKPEENVPIYHSDERINSAVRAMMSMGFANEGAMLTQLLVTVNGNISEAIDILMATQQ